MATKLTRKSLPSGTSPSEFRYRGRPAVEQGDFGSDVGIADMACVNQFGDANNAKGYHAGVVQSSDGRWWVYLEWGRIQPGVSWEGGHFRRQDYQFVQCTDETEARNFFRKQCTSKNTKRLEQREVAGKLRWCGKSGKDGYFVQRLATRETGLPDAYTIKDNSGLPADKPEAKVAAAGAAPTASAKAFQPQVLALASDLVGGTKTYARALSEATGVIPTMAAIEEVRDDIIPAALKLLSHIGGDENRQMADKDLQDLSKYAATIVPRPIPRSGDARAIILSQSNILSIQQDLDAFEASLKNEDFTTDTAAPSVDPDKLLGREITWIDPNSDHGRWLAATFQSMTRNRHGDLAGRRLQIKNMFTVASARTDKPFLASVKRLATARRASSNHEPVGLQPSRRIDLSDVSDYAAEAGIFLGIHGTRGVNIAPILQGNLRMPKSLAGVHITGAAFGHGIYFATDYRKSYGYTGYSSRWGASGGSIRGRGFFMFLADVAGGKHHYVRRAWSINGARCPGGADSVYAHPRYTTVQNDEHVIFDPAHQRIRYLIEGEL